MCATPAICLNICVNICVNSNPRSIGPTDLTLNTIFPDNSSTISTVTDNLVQQGIIKQNVVGVYFEPSNSTVGMGSNSTLGIVNGELTFSGTNPTKYIGDITYQ